MSDLRLYGIMWLPTYSVWVRESPVGIRGFCEVGSVMPSLEAFTERAWWRFALGAPLFDER